MTHLEILAGRLSLVAWESVEMAVRHDRSVVVSLRDYYLGKAVGLATAADQLRRAALDREGMDKEETG